MKIIYEITLIHSFLIHSFYLDPFQGLMGTSVEHPNSAFGSSNSSGSAYQKWPTRHLDSTPGSRPVNQASYPFKVLK